jgi:putative ABC transport system permease protein
MIRRRRVVPEQSRLCLRDLAAESLAGLAQRPGRSVLTLLGTILGTGAFVAVLGLAATANGQIGKQFSVLSATTVTVNDVGSQQNQESWSPALDDFPADADARVDQMHGVIQAGVWWQVQLSEPVISASPDAVAGSEDDNGALPVYAASAGALRAIQPSLTAGELFGSFDVRNAEPVVVLGPAAASALGISNLTAQPAIYINGLPFTVVGIISNAQRLPEMLGGIIVPTTTAENDFGPPQTTEPPQMLIWTRIGAADQVAAEAPLALRPDDPSLFSADAPPDKWNIERGVDASLEELFLSLAGLSLFIGAVGIANTTLIAVLERTGEIGLRRSLGARPRHIAAQVLCESGTLGLLGGLIGASLAVLLVIGVALARQWTAILDPGAAYAAPLAGAAMGVLAGLYPALRASRIEPLEALRS